MPAIIEHLVSLLRIGKDTLNHGDPYEMSVVVRWLSPTKVELIGMTTFGERFKTSHFRSIRETLRRAGATEAVWTRKNTDKERHLSGR